MFVTCSPSSAMRLRLPAPEPFPRAWASHLAAECLYDKLLCGMLMRQALVTWRLRGTQVEQRMVNGLLALVAAERGGETVDRSLLSNLLRCFISLGTYLTAFQVGLCVASQGWYGDLQLCLAKYWHRQCTAMQHCMPAVCGRHAWQQHDNWHEAILSALQAGIANSLFPPAGAVPARHRGALCS